MDVILRLRLREPTGLYGLILKEALILPAGDDQVATPIGTFKVGGREFGPRLEYVVLHLVPTSAIENHRVHYEGAAEVLEGAGWVRWIDVVRRYEEA